MSDETATIDPAITEKYVEMSVENMILKAEKKQAQEAAKQAQAAQPAPAPAVEEPDRNDPAWWSADPHITDRRYDSQHPRNQEGSAANAVANKDILEWQLRLQREAWDAEAKADAEVVGTDAQGRKVTRGEQRRAEVSQRIFDSLTAAPDPVYTSDGRELVDPTQPEDAPINDPTDAKYQLTIDRWARNRQARRNEENRKAGRPWEPYQPPGHVPTERESRLQKARQVISEGVAQALGRTPEAQAVRDHRIKEALKAGDKHLAYEIMDGRA